MRAQRVTQRTAPVSEHLFSVAVVALRQRRRVQRRNGSHGPLDLQEAFAPLDAALLVAARRVLPLWNYFTFTGFSASDLGAGGLIPSPIRPSSSAGGYRSSGHNLRIAAIVL